MLETYEVNIIGFNLLLHALLPYLSKHASIVGISSQAAFITQANAAHYGASKAAFNAVLNALRLEHPSYHVMSVNPDLFERLFTKSRPKSCICTQV